MNEYTTQDTSEVWRDIPDYNGIYQVSDIGRVRSVERYTTGSNRWGTQTTQHIKGRVLSQSLNTCGRPFVGLFLQGRGYKSTMVHTIVAEVFLGPRPEGHAIHHKNHDRTDNRASNLEYMPNVEHCRLHMSGNIPGNAKLAAHEVDAIRTAIASGNLSQAEIARRHGVSPATITMIKQGKRWNR